MHKITFNGTASDTLGVRIERSPRIIRPRRKSDVVTIPGRNGDIVFMRIVKHFSCAEIDKIIKRIFFT